ncbi:CopG family transcriptional regulator [Actinomyces oricola]|uniref:CopG family transcriptional regulator n=1 Tax=Actinomyces oricola TaxID=206043 RepID=UPI000FFE4F69|nr:CopG family transcriptional regulator [Actinomyces oricola]
MSSYAETLGRSMREVSSLGDERTQEVAGSLVSALDPALRLTLLQMLCDIATQIEDDLDTVRATVVMDGPTPHLMLTEVIPEQPPGQTEHRSHRSDEGGESEAPGSGTAHEGPATGSESPAGDGNDTRTTLRMPAALKTEVDAAAQAQGVSVNTWLLAAVRARLGGQAGPPPGGPFYGPQPTRSSPSLHGWFG